MKVRHNLKKLTSKLTSILDKAGYQFRKTTAGWHLHKGNIYCGNLQYQPMRGWQGSALSHLPAELLEQLKNLAK